MWAPSLTIGSVKNQTDSAKISKNIGGGGVVTVFYDVCNEIWSESAAAESTETGLESIVSLGIRKQILCKKLLKITLIRNSDKKKLLLWPVGLLASPL